MITSVGKHVYTSGTAANFVGTPGVFKLSDPGSRVTGYLYSLHGEEPDQFVKAGKDGTAKLAITPNTPFPSP